MNPNNLLLQSLKDFLTKPMLKLTFLPFVITLALMYTLFFVAVDFGLDSLQDASVQIERSHTTVQNGIEHTENESAEYAGSGIVEFLMKHTITSWLVTFLVYTVGGVLVLILSVIIAVIVVGLLTPLILRELRRMHYPDVDLVGFGNLLSPLWFALVQLLITLALLLVLIPLYFVPVVNVIAFGFPFYYLFHKLVTYDVASTLCTKEEYAQIRYAKAGTIRIKTLFLYLLSMIPFVAILGSVFFIIYIGHTYFAETRKIRNRQMPAEETEMPPVADALTQ